MGTKDDSEHDPSANCTTTTSFEDHGLADGSTLIRETHYRLVESGTTDEAGVPPHVGAAIADARSRTHEAFRETDDANLRTEVIPAFYQRVAGFHCIYR